MPSSVTPNQSAASAQRVSVIIPAHNAASDIEACLKALRPCVELGMEILVVDDASTDDTSAIAARCGVRVLRTGDRAEGPAAARNQGVAESQGEILVFVDADVCVHPGTVEAAVAQLERDPQLGAVSGAYDINPLHPQLISQWRNLLHCYTHRTGRRDTNTFWTGFGAIRRSVFENAGGFEPSQRYLEDMLLGRKLAREGVRLRLDPALQVQHRKRWTLWSMIHTDTWGRAIPYTQIMLREGDDGDLNTKADQKASVGLTGLAVASALVAAWTAQPPYPSGWPLWALLAALVCIIGVGVLNLPYYRFLKQSKSAGFAIRAFPLHLLYFFYSGAGYLYARLQTRMQTGGTAALARLAILLACVVGVQWLGGAYGVETRGDPDEPAHIVTGLMARDYMAGLLSGSVQDPMAFARDYYVHYPKVALGHWPPGFYALQAAWMLVFPATRSALLLLMALLAALLAAGLYPILQKRFGAAAAWCGCLAMLTLPGVAASASQIMTEMAMAIFITGAMITLGRYLDTGGWPHALAFGVFGAAALLTKGSGLVLAPVPLIAIALTRRWDLLFRPSLWLAGLIAGGLSAPWYLLAPEALHEEVAPLGEPTIATWRIDVPPRIWAPEFGWVVATLALIGCAVYLVQILRGERLPGVWAAALTLVLSASVFPMLFGVWERRHQLESAPAFVAMAVAGAAWLLSLGSRAATGKVLGTGVRWVLVAGTAALVIWNLSQIPRIEAGGQRQLAHAIASGEAGEVKVLLVSGNGRGEGTLISEIAQQEQRPESYVLRASTVLGAITWQGSEIEERFGSAADLSGYLQELPLDLVVLDRANPAGWSYERLLSEVLKSHPEEWEPWEAEGVPAERFEIYRWRDLPRSSEASDQIRSLLGEVGAPPL